MALTSFLKCDTLFFQIGVQVAGCIILGIGIAFEIRCGSITMPGEGFPAAISKYTGTPFPKAKITVDICLVATAVILGFVYFHEWLWNVIGPGTLFTMFFVGVVVKFMHHRLSWFDRLLHIAQTSAVTSSVLPAPSDL